MAKLCKVFHFRSRHEKCPDTELFLVRIQSEYRKIRTRNNSVFGHFSRSEEFQNYLGLQPKAHFLIQKKEIFLKAVKTCSKQRYQTFP